MNYRPELDGLRSIAVLSVMLFHAGFVSFSGGYIGVDVFFVISGYLITAIVYKDIQDGKFSLLKFYEKRIRRLLPALLLVTITTIPIAYTLLLPKDLFEYFESLIGISTFSANIFFWKQSGYFASDASLKPLLHTWSLSIEQQFYFGFPIVLITAWRLGKKYIPLLLIAGSFISLVFAHWGSHNIPSSTFYLLPSRIWEFGIGSLTYMIYSHYTGKDRRILIDEIMSATGLTLILVPVFLYDEATPFPSLYTIAPTIGTAFILFSAEKCTSTHKILTNKYLVGIGLISYSTYLWHNPIITFYRYRFIDISEYEALYLILASLIMGYLTWLFVEKPFRSNGKIARKKTWALCIIATLLCVVSGATGQLTSYKGTEAHIQLSDCQADCYSMPDSRFDVAIWGDSFANVPYRALGELLQKHKINTTPYLMASCPSIMRVIRNEDKRIGYKFSELCHQHNINALNSILSKKPKYVVLTSAYSWYLDSVNKDGDFILLDEEHPHQAPQSFLPTRLADTIQSIDKNGSHVIIITPHPIIEDFSASVRKIHFGIADQISGNLLKAKQDRNTLLSELNLRNIEYSEISGIDIFCKEEACSMFDSYGRPALSDGSHISAFQAPKLAEKVFKIIEENEKYSSK